MMMRLIAHLPSGGVAGGRDCSIEGQQVVPAAAHLQLLPSVEVHVPARRQRRILCGKRSTVQAWHRADGSHHALHMLPG